MSQDDVTQIRVGGTQVGVVGLNAVLKHTAEKYGDRTDQEVQEELLSRLSRKNYIPETVRGEYEKAFLREFKKFLGKPFEEEIPEGIEIKILGPGCAQCDRLEQEMMQALAETGVLAGLEHVRDIKEIGKYGVMGTPALLMNGVVKSVGKVPPRNKLKEWLKEAQKQ